MARYPNEIIEESERRRPCSRSRVVITHVVHFPSFISACAIARPDVESALGQRGTRRRRGEGGEIFDRRRDAAVSFISRQEQDPRRSFRPRTGPSRDVIVALHLSPSRFPPLRCGPAIFFCSTLKPGNEGGGGGGKERRERERKHGGTADCR